jgi:hypothetical protein
MNMKTWTITVAYDVPRFAHIDVEAESEAEAIRKAIAEAPQHEFETGLAGPLNVTVRTPHVLAGVSSPQ